MRKMIFGALILGGILLVGRASAAPAPIDDVTGWPMGTTRFHDDELKVTCWVFSHGYKGGITCIPHKEKLMAVAEVTLEGIRTYMTWLPGFMRGKDSERIELLLNLVLRQEEELAVLRSEVESLYEQAAGASI